MPVEENVMRIIPATVLLAAALTFSASVLAAPAKAQPNDGKFHPVAETKKAGRAVGHTTRKVTRAIGHGARDGTRAIGHAFRDGARELTGKK
jgi:hypothetical protein